MPRTGEGARTGAGRGRWGRAKRGHGKRGRRERRQPRPRRRPPGPSYAAGLREAMDVILRPLLGASKAARGRSRRVVWVPLLLAATAVLAAWDPSPTLGDRFAAAGVALSGLFPRRRRGQTYRGFVKALKACRVAGPPLDKRVAAFLRDRLRRVAEAGGGRGEGKCWRRLGWCAFAADGSKFDVPRTKKNEDAFGTSGRKKSGPQQYPTSLWHRGTGLPWAWEQGPARSSERAHLRQMLPLLPGGPEAPSGADGVLLVADAGFVGYDLLRDVTATGRHFLIRVGANVRLLTKLGWAVDERAGTVYLRPDGQQGKGRPPLVLRLVRLVRLAAAAGGGKPVCLLTDVADPGGRLSDEAAGALYRLRWGVELFYRAAKQTLGRRKMCSAAPAQAALELAWSVPGLMLPGLMAVERVIEAGRDPLGWGTAAALRAVRRAIRTPAARPRTPLAEQLAGAVKDDYKRAGSKKARNWPHKKKDKPPGEPNVRDAIGAEVALAKAIRETKAAA